MKKILPFIALCTVFMTCNLYAQTKEDAVYLYDGSILRGRVIENVNGVKTTIEIVGHNIIVIPDSLIKMILMDQVIPGKNRENRASPVEMAANVNFYGGSQNSGGFTFITSYRFPFRLAVGGGIGIEWFEHQQIPFMADVKYYFLKGSWSPYVYAQGGYAVPLSQKSDNEWTEYHGGVLTGTGAGLRFNFTRRNALIFSVGYRYQKTETITNDYPWMSTPQTSETIRYDEYNRLTFSFGFVFN
jgi:hypothetical protein